MHFLIYHITYGLLSTFGIRERFNSRFGNKNPPHVQIGHSRTAWRGNRRKTPFVSPGQLQEVPNVHNIRPCLFAPRWPCHISWGLQISGGLYAFVHSVDLLIRSLVHMTLHHFSFRSPAVRSHSYIPLPHAFPIVCLRALFIGTPALSYA